RYPTTSPHRKLTRQPEPPFRMNLHQNIFFWLARCASQTRSQEIELHVAASRQDSIAAGCRRCSREHTLKAGEAFARSNRRGRRSARKLGRRRTRRGLERRAVASPRGGS